MGMVKAACATGLPGNQPPKAEEPQSREAILKLFSELSPVEQAQVFAELSKSVNSIPAPRAGDVLGTLIRVLPRTGQCTVGEIKQNIKAAGVPASPKEIHNALGYLTRKGQIRRVGYGRYLFNGVGIVTSEDLGGEPARYED